MTVLLLRSYATFAQGAIVDLDNATEAALVNQGRATYTVNPGPVFDPLTASEQQALRDSNVGSFTAAQVAATQALVSGAGNSSAEISAYTSAVTAAGGALSTGEATALAAFVASAKSAGYWTKLNDVMPLCGGFAGCTVKLKSQYGSALRLVGMSSGDYGSLGLTGDGSSKYVRTGVMYSDASRAGVGGLACFLTAHGTATSASQFMGVSWGALGTRMGFLWNGASASTVLATFDGSDTIESSAVANAKPPVGLYHIERSSTTLAKFYGNGSPITADLTATITPTVQAVEVTLLAGASNASSANLYSTATVGFAATTNGTMTPNEARAFAAHVGRLMFDLGRVQPVTTPAKLLFPVIGQSLAIGAQSSAVSTSQPYSNRMQPGGTIAHNPADARPASLVTGFAAMGAPLIEKTRETIASGCANTISATARSNGLGAAWDSHWINMGIGASTYAALAKGTAAYSNAIAFLSLIQDELANPLGTPVTVPAIFCVHGEQDYASGTYQADIAQWRRTIWRALPR